MGVTRHVSNTRQEVQIAMRALEAKYNLNPLQQAIHDPLAVKNPHPDKFVLSWANPAKLDEKKRRGSQIVTAEEGRKLYGCPASDVAGNVIKRMGCILIRTPRVAHEARVAMMGLNAYNKLGEATEAFNALPGARTLSEGGRVLRDGEIARAKSHNIRPERPSIEDVLYENRRKQDDAAEAAKARNEEIMATIDPDELVDPTPELPEEESEYDPALDESGTTIAFGEAQVEAPIDNEAAAPSYLTKPRRSK